MNLMLLLLPYVVVEEATVELQNQTLYPVHPQDVEKANQELPCAVPLQFEEPHPVVEVVALLLDAVILQILRQQLQDHLKHGARHRNRPGQQLEFLLLLRYCISFQGFVFH